LKSVTRIVRARKFRHGDDYWVAHIGPSPTSPAPVWTKFLEYPFDFPNGMVYNVGSNRWSTDWDFVQPVVTDTAGNYDNSSSTINFNLASAPSASGSAIDLYGPRVELLRRHDHDAQWP